MINKTFWKISAGQNGYLINEFLGSGLAAVDFGVTPKMADTKSIGLIKDMLFVSDRELPATSINYRAGRIFAFVNKIKKGDYIIFYDRKSILYFVGEVEDEARYNHELPIPLCRNVNWFATIDKNRLSKNIKNALSAQQLFYRINENIRHELLPYLDDSDDTMLNVLNYSRKKVASRKILSDESAQNPPYNILSYAGVGGETTSSYENKYIRVPLLFATDRAPTSNDRDIGEFSSIRSNNIHYGKIEVTIPLKHKLGHVESAPFWKIFNRNDPSKYVVINSSEILLKSDYMTELRKRLYLSKSNDVLIFVHGYNMTFNEAAKRTAQIAFDLDFRGTPILYSWPSKGKAFSYTADEATIDWSAHNLSDFLYMIGQNTNAKEVHLFAHSMGNRALLTALDQIDLTKIRNKKLFSQIIMAAPDVDTGVFKKLINKISGKGEKFTLYASSNDKALRASKRWHNYQRAGYTIPNILILNRLDSIDATSVDTNLYSYAHSYATNKKSVLSDIFYLIKDRKSPDHRFGLLKHGTLNYWSFKP